MVISLARMLQSFGQEQEDLPTMAAKNVQQAATSHNIQSNESSRDNNQSQSDQPSVLTAPKRAERICDALAEVNDIRTPTPLTDRYLAKRAQ